jgi:uncharacterized membrane protein HdeD (DUF308 family)
MKSDDSGWWVPLVMGIVAIVFGLLLFTNPAGTSIWIAWLVGIYWFIGGVMNLVSLFVDRTQWGWKLVLGLLGIFAGMVVISAMGRTPLLATVGLAAIYVFVLGLQGIVFGVIQIIQAFQGGGWGVGILGVVSILFGALLMANPIIAGLALPWVFGVFAVVGGIAGIVLAFKAKNA